MRAALTVVAVLAALLMLAPRAQAQEADDSLASLMADRVQVLGNSAIVAEGNIEIFYDGTRITASALRYDGTTQKLVIEGPITLDDGKGAVVLASEGELDADLRNGILKSARLVLNQQLQIAAVEITRVEGRYTQLYKTVASSCQVCARNPVPLWQIRAERVVHDTETRQLYFEKARFEVAGLPIAYIPRLRIPDPTVKRATGFLVPSLANSSTLGTGIKLPYFIVINDSTDATIAPFITPYSTTVEGQFRKAFTYGNIEFNGAISDDDLTSASLRGYLFGTGSFDLPRDYKLGFDIALVSDAAYLDTYDFDSRDRLNNELRITRVSRDEYTSARLITIRTLRESEIPTEDELPFLLGEVIHEQRFVPDLIGGNATWQIEFDGYGRTSSADHVGRDGLHFGTTLDWSREWVLGAGVLGRLSGELASDIFVINQDSDYDRVQAQATPSIAAELRWPLLKADEMGGMQVLEPVAQIAWSGQAGADVPNEYSTLVEFDEGNLLSLSRFPGSDRNERGFRTAVGLTYSRVAPADQWSATLGASRVYHSRAQDGFSDASGLSGLKSDWLLAAHMSMGTSTSLISRNLVSDDFDLTKSESTLAWAGEKLTLGATYTYVIPDLDEDRPDLTSELLFDTGYQITRHWTTKLKGRYDFNANRPASAGVGLVYRNECIMVDLSVAHRFTSTVNLSPSTSAQLKVSLAGFGGGEDTRAYRRQCMR